jgi:alpha-L-rhamnosidase
MSSWRPTLTILTAAAVSGLTAASAAQAAPPPAWQHYVLGPSTANVHPVAVQSTSGSVSDAQALVSGHGAATLTMTPGGPAPTIVLDYGQDVGGVPYFQVDSETGTPTLGASYSEGLPYISPAGDGGPSQSGAGDGSRADQLTVTGPGQLTTGLIQGGERYHELTLTTPGTVTISSAWIHFTAYRATPSDYRGWFDSSSDELNRIWYDGAYTTQLDQVPRDSLPTSWSITDGSLDANGGNIGVLRNGASWTDYTDAFQTEILSRQAGWVVRAAADGSSGYLFILDADNDPSNGGGPTDTLQELHYDNGNYQSIADVPLGVDLAPNTWHAVSTTLSGPTITVSLDGRQVSTVNTSQLPSGIPALTSGTVGFREYPGERARFRNLSVTSASGSSLYSNSLAAASALGDFTGPPVTTPDPLPVILDGAKRDRVVWSGDLGVEGPNVFYTTAANSYVRGSLQLLASYQNANGESGTNVPPTVPVGTFPESGYTYSASYSMDEVDNIATYYRYTGDLAFVRSEWPMIQRELAYNRGMVDTRGLLVTDGSDGLDWDYYDGAKTGAVTAYNVIYYQTLRDAATMARALGDTGDAATYASRAASLRAAINQYLFDPSAGLYAVSDARPGTFAQDGNALAIVDGVAPAGQAAAIAATLRSQLPSTPYGPLPFSTNTGYRQAVSPFVTNEEVQALFTVGDTAGATGLLQTVWGHMDAPGPDYTGADWELVGSDGTPGFGGFTSLAHGWASGATADLSAYVLGVQPTAAGYRRWTIAPQPGDLAWADGRVPTRHGPISVSWRRPGASGNLQLQASVPDGTTGEISVPVPSGGTAVLHGRTSGGSAVHGVQHASGSASFSIGSGGSYAVTVSH